MGEVETMTTGLPWNGCIALESHSSALFKALVTECCCSGEAISTISAFSIFSPKAKISAGASTPSLNIGKPFTVAKSKSYLYPKFFMIILSNFSLNELSAFEPDRASTFIKTTFQNSLVQL